MKKKFLSVICGALVLCGTFTSCDKDADLVENIESTENAISRGELIGTWESSYTYGSGDNEYTIDVTLTINDDDLEYKIAKEYRNNNYGSDNTITFENAKYTFNFYDQDFRAIGLHKNDGTRREDEVKTISFEKIGDKYIFDFESMYDMILTKK